MTGYDKEMKEAEYGRCNDPNCEVLNPNKSVLKEDLVWSLLERIQFLPVYHSQSKEELLFELGKIYQEFVMKKRNQDEI